MFQTLNVDVLGNVENMASFAWPGTAQVEAAIASLDGVEGAADLASLQAALDEHGQVPIFGSGGGRREAERQRPPSSARSRSTAPSALAATRASPSCSRSPRPVGGRSSTSPRR